MSFKNWNVSIELLGYTVHDCSFLVLVKYLNLGEIPFFATKIYKEENFKIFAALPLEFLVNFAFLSSWYFFQWKLFLYIFSIAFFMKKKHSN